MLGYWIRHRLFFSVILSIAVAWITSFLFAFPYIMQRANSYNTQSIYQNTSIDFIAPEPSFEQVDKLSGNNGIDKIFPYYLTKTSVNVKGVPHSATVLLSDEFQDIDITMYGEKRLIEQSDQEFEHPIFVDWRFCQDTSAAIGDTVSFSIAGRNVEYRIYAIYETNSIYESGAILAQIGEEEREAISARSNNNGYSGMYISASDYNVCQRYLTMEYRPLGRLKSREQFDSDEQYRVHYDAITSSGYANEITDFRVRESSLSNEENFMLIWIGVLLSVGVLIVYNIVMAKRGCEKVYFTKHCIPKGQDVKTYYNISLLFESIACIVLFTVVLVLKVKFSNDYIPKIAMDIKIAAIPVAVMITEIICRFMNYAMIAKSTKGENEVRVI